MIVSASRRTDIPAFYGEWFMNRIKAGFCLVRNPFNPNQIQKVSLKLKDVDCFVFWTRNSNPFFKPLAEIKDKGIPFYFLFTLTGYGKVLEKNLPNLTSRIACFKRLADFLGPTKVIWRYDPIIISQFYSFDWHLKMFEKFVCQLSGFTERVIVSFVDYYKKTKKGLSVLDDHFFLHPELDQNFKTFVRTLVSLARSGKIQMFSCAEELDLKADGLLPGKCIDDQLIYSISGNSIETVKDPNQRKYCRCVKSKDIGAYNTCPYGCLYCYATSSQSGAANYLKKFDPNCEWLG